MQNILITGTAGFIAYHLSRRLMNQGSYNITGIDSLNDYYDINLKYDRLNNLGIAKEKIKYNKAVKNEKGNLEFYCINLEDKSAIDKVFESKKFDVVINLAAQAGVRYSIENPYAYIDSNISGFLNILEGCRHNHCKHLIFASSSSVYGLNESLPFNTGDNVDHPVSLYAATKKSNELMAHTYAYLYDIPVTGLRFFTVYGPWGRPDMALFIFTDKILKGETIDVYNHGNMLRDFTYIDDIIESIYRLLDKIPQKNPNFSGLKPDPSISSAPYRLFNIGNNSPVKLMDFVHAIEETTAKKAKINFMPIQPGDVPATFADVNSLIEVTGFKPNTSITKGVEKFVEWYKEYYIS